MSKADDLENNVLQLILENLATGTTVSALGSGLRNSTTAGNLQVGLHTGTVGDAGNQTTNEATYTSYARVAVSRADGSWTVTGNDAVNASAITFPKSTGTATNEIVAWSIGTAATGAGNLVYWGYFADASKPMVADDTAGDTFTVADHGYAQDDNVVFFAVEGDALPTGVTEGTKYWVIGTPTTHTFQVSTTQDGAALNYTTTGAGRVAKLNPKTIGLDDTPEIAGSALTITED